MNLRNDPFYFPLTTKALHPSGVGATERTLTTDIEIADFSSKAVSVAHDAVGNVTSRTWANGRSQTYTWDAFGRIVKVEERTAGGTIGFDYLCEYDGRGRRVRTTWTPVSNSQVRDSLSRVVLSIYDPEYTYMEIGVHSNQQTWWKLHGPDLNGQLGGLHGIGGLEAVVRDSDGATQGVLNDQFGHLAAFTDFNGVWQWKTDPVTGYGVATGQSLPSFNEHTSLLEAMHWRGYRADPTGLVHMGQRSYDPIAGRFLSPDPLGHDASMDLYSAFNGDPINFVDPTGRAPRANGGRPGLSPGEFWNAFSSGWSNSGPVLNTANIFTLIDQGHIDTPNEVVSVYGGTLLSLFTGDFYKAPAQYSSSDTIFSMNGIRTDGGGALEMAAAISMANNGADVTPLANNTFLGGIGDGIQIIAEELGFTTTPSINMAVALNDAGSSGNQLAVYAHSQGTSVSANAFRLTDPNILANTEYYGFGGQTYIEATSWGLNSSANIHNPGDIVSQYGYFTYGATFRNTDYSPGNVSVLTNNNNNWFGLPGIEPHLFSNDYQNNIPAASNVGDPTGKHVCP